MQNQQHRDLEPYFKPLSQSQNDNPFTLSCGTDSNYFAPLSKSSAMFQQGDGTWMDVGEDQTSSERLSTLHARLNKEADKIRNWKVQTEIELKRKNEQLKESGVTVEALRKSLLELQIQNETLSLTLQEELDNREELLQKIDSTRSMCNYLKEFTSKIDKNLVQCETERSELKYQCKEYQKEFEELTEKFQQLRVSAEQKEIHLQEIIETLKIEKDNNEKDWAGKLTDVEIKLTETIAECSEKDTMLQENRETLSYNKKTIEKLQTEIESLEQKLLVCQKCEESCMEEIKKLTDELQTQQNCRQDMERALESTSTQLQEVLFSKDKLAQNFDETEKLYVEKIQHVQEDYNNAKVQLDETQERIEELSANLSAAQNTIEDLKSVKDMLILEHTELKQKSNELEASKEELQNKNATLEKNLQESQTQVTQLSVRLQEEKITKEELVKKIEEISLDKSEAENRYDILNSDFKQMNITLKEKEEELIDTSEKLRECELREFKLEKEIHHIKEKLINEVNERDRCLAHIEEMKDENRLCQEDMKSKQKEINKLAKELETSKAAHSKLEKKLEETYRKMETMKAEIMQMEEKVREQAEEAERRLHDEMTNTKDLQNVLETKVKATSNLETKTKDLKAEVAAKKKEIKELEKEVKSLKRELTQQAKQTSMVEEAKQQMEGQINELHHDKATLEEQINDLQKKVDEKSAEIKEVSCQKDEFKKQADREVKEKEAADKNFNKQMTQMVATLENYKLENNKIVAQKQKEIDELRKCLEDDGKKKDSEMKDLTKMKTELSELKSKLEEYENDLSNCKEEIKDRDEKISSLTSGLSKKDDKIKVMEKDLEELRKSLEEAKKAAKEAAENMAKTPIPQTQKMKQCLPKTPKQFAQVSPLRDPIMTSTPLRTVKIPSSNSMLKPATFASAKKKRRVNFGSDKDGSSSSCSSPGLMEVELHGSSKNPNKKTPVLIPPSPRNRPLTSPCYARSTFVQPKPVARGPPVKQRKIKSNSELITKEMEKFKNLYSVQASPARSNMYVKQTPTRSGGKFFKSTPVLHKSKSKLLEAHQGTNWLDSDDVFGFDSDM